MTDTNQPKPALLDVTVSYQAVRFTDGEKAIIEAYAKRLYQVAYPTGEKVQYDSVLVHQLRSGAIQVYTYQRGFNVHSYDTCDNFESKAYFVGYCRGCVAMVTGDKDLLK